MPVRPFVRPSLRLVGVSNSKTKKNDVEKSVSVRAFPLVKSKPGASVQYTKYHC